jgi:hypothetical protein
MICHGKSNLARRLGWNDKTHFLSGFQFGFWALISEKCHDLVFGFVYLLGFSV